MEFCDICGKERNDLNKFYWGFFKIEYEPDKWIEVCPECQKRFLQASNIYNLDRTPLIELEKEIKNKRRVR